MGSIIVTIINKERTLNLDMELPLSTTADRLFPHVIEIVKEVRRDTLWGTHPNRIINMRTGTVICGEESIEEWGVWNGDILMLTGGR